MTLPLIDSMSRDFGVTRGANGFEIGQIVGQIGAVKPFQDVMDLRGRFKSAGRFTVLAKRIAPELHGPR